MSSSRQHKKLLVPGQPHDSNRSKNASISRGSKIGARNPVFASQRSNLVSSASKRPQQGGTERVSNIRAHIQILDEAGNDVTPLPLLQIDPNMMKKTQASVIGDGSVGTPTDLMSQASASIYGTQAGGTATTSLFGGGPFTRSVFTQSYDATTDSLPPDEAGTPDAIPFSEVRHKRQEVQEVPTEEDLGKIVDITLTETDTIWMFDLPDVKVSVESEEAPIVQERNKIYAELQKSRAGNDLYAERGMNTFNEPPKSKSVYTQKIELNTVGVECTHWDMYDTYDIIEKEKKASTVPESNPDSIASAKEEAEEEEGTISRPSSPKNEEDAAEAKSEHSELVGNENKETVSATSDKPREGSAVNTGRESRNTMASSVLGSEVQSSLETTVELTDKEKLTQEWEELAKSEQLRHHLFLMERVVNLNTYQTKQAQYRGFQTLTAMPRRMTRKLLLMRLAGGYSTSEVKPSGSFLQADVKLPVPLRFRTEEDEKQEAIEAVKEQQPESPKSLGQVQVQDMGPNLDRLWSYTCNLTKGKNVSCIAWNGSNPDLVAVGYGQFEFTQQKPGLVCCWCIKNPEYPERVFTTSQGVTALDFSTANANLLAVGYYDGGIAVYNVRKSVDEPVLDNFVTAGKHLGPVWQLKWIEKERGSGEEQSEVLISISTDGRVCQWSIRKGFESYDVMKLKKMPTRMAGRSREKKGEAFISRFSGGMCFDFHGRDSNIYLAGTEEGYIHKCSCSHNEQYLESYQGHTAPVYTVQWSPFVPDIFLSCSADWTIKLWHQEKTKPILSFHSSTKAVNDVRWSPWSSTVFACVNEMAVEVWDMAQSTLDAVYTISPTSGAKQTSVAFSKNSQCLLVGDSEGQVTVYELRCMRHPSIDQDGALKEVIKASLASQLPDPLEAEVGDEEEEHMESED